MSTIKDPFGREVRRTARLSDEETKQRMLEAGVRMVNDTGLQLSFELVRLEDVITSAGVSRSAVYRRWPTKAHYFADLLRELAGANHPGEAAYSTDTVELAIRLAKDNVNALRTPEGRRTVVVELCRQGALQNFHTIAPSRQWQTYVALQATLLALPHDLDLQADMARSLRRSEDRFLSRMEDFYANMARIAGYRVRDLGHAFNFRTVATLGAAMVEGLAVNSIPIPEVGTSRFVADPFNVGRTSEWSLPALGFTSVVMNLIEPIDGSVWEDGRMQEAASQLTTLYTSQHS